MASTVHSEHTVESKVDWQEMRDDFHTRAIAHAVKEARDLSKWPDDCTYSISEREFTPLTMRERYYVAYSCIRAEWREMWQSCPNG